MKLLQCAARSRTDWRRPDRWIMRQPEGELTLTECGMNLSGVKLSATETAGNRRLGEVVHRPHKSSAWCRNPGNITSFGQTLGPAKRRPVSRIWLSGERSRRIKRPRSGRVCRSGSRPTSTPHSGPSPCSRCCGRSAASQACGHRQVVQPSCFGECLAISGRGTSWPVSHQEPHGGERLVHLTCCRLQRSRQAGQIVRNVDDRDGAGHGGFLAVRPPLCRVSRHDNRPRIGCGA